MSNSDALRYARWQVLWVSKGKVVRKDFGTDLWAARQLYDKAKDAAKPMATLRCTNVGFPPPDKYHKVEVVRKERVMVNGRPKLRKLSSTVSMMGKVNRKGIWWCPYCMELRKFKLLKGYRISGVWVSDPHYACPMCGATHRDFHVRVYNPLADRVEAALSRRRVGRRSTRAKRRRRAN